MQEYIKLATVTESRIDKVVLNHEHLENLLNAYIQIGNVLDTVKKSAFYGKPIDPSLQNKRLSNTLTSVASLLGADFTEDAEPLKIDPRVFHSVVGIATEGTELVEAVFNAEFRNEQFDTVNMVEELFDVMWYILVAHDATKQELENTLEMGFAKLKLRFSDKFTAAGALNRDLASERELLVSYVQPE
jgi:NTP pyrophosphatase (non-canonical NTP hydrolase)